MEGKYEESAHAIYMFLIQVFESLNMSEFKIESSGVQELGNPKIRK